jgi:type IV secretory pathway VirB2 component (pilin)
MLTLLQTTLPALSSVPSGTPYVAGWGTLSLVNAGIAQSKGRSGLLWWVCSLLLGPVATLLIVVLPKLRNQADQPSYATNP